MNKDIEKSFKDAVKNNNAEMEQDLICANIQAELTKAKSKDAMREIIKSAPKEMKARLIIHAEMIIYYRSK